MKKTYSSLKYIFCAFLMLFTFCFFGCSEKTELITTESITLEQLYNYTEEGEIISLTELGKQQTTIEIPQKINNTEIKKINYLGSATVKNIIIKDNIEFISMGALRDNVCLQSLTVPFLGNPKGIRDEYDRFGSTNSYPDLWYFFTNPIDQTNFAKTNLILPKTLKHINITGSTLVDEIEIGLLNGYYIESISLPDKFKIEYGFGFAGCNQLKSITVDVNNTKYDSRNNCNAIIETETNTLIKGCINSIIPNNVTTIGENAFNGVALKDIIIPSSVVKIGTSAFSNIGTLENTIVFIPASVKEIDRYAFSFDTITGFIFEQPAGWKWQSSNTTISSEKLNDPETAYQTIRQGLHMQSLINIL